MEYRACYEEGSRCLREAGIAEAGLDARLLLEYVCGTEQSYLFAHGEQKVTPEQCSRYRELIAGRAGRTPLQYLTGEQAFMGLTFQVNEHVLIPRQDTEILVERAWKSLKPGMHILDMCTGSGCILISLLHLAKGCSGVGADISEEALKVAGNNSLNILSGDVPVKWINSDLFEKIEDQFDIIVSNPPYIPTAQVEELMPEVRVHEPRGALDGKENGLYFYRRIAEESGEYLKENGRLLLEIGYDQGQRVKTLLLENGFEEVRVIQDYAGLDRVVCGRKA